MQSRLGTSSPLHCRLIEASSDQAITSGSIQNGYGSIGLVLVGALVAVGVVTTGASWMLAPAVALNA
eukprot:11257586-Alexandrium_andersonii.AAC.1